MNISDARTCCQDILPAVANLPPSKFVNRRIPAASGGERGNHDLGANPPSRAGAQSPFAPARQLTPQAEEGDDLTFSNSVSMPGRRAKLACCAGLACLATAAL